MKWVPLYSRHLTKAPRGLSTCVQNRVAEIRKDLARLRQNCRLAGEDYILDWVALEIEKDEVAGDYRWSEPKKIKKAGVKASETIQN